MNEKGAWLAIISSIILLSGFTGITLYQDVFADAQKTLICHKPGTSAEKEMEVSDKALENHMKHGDSLGPCNVTEPPQEGFTKIKCNCEGGNGNVPVCTQIFCSDTAEVVGFCEDYCQDKMLGSTTGNTCENSAGCTLPIP